MGSLLCCGHPGKTPGRGKGLDNLETVFLMGLVHDIGKMLLMKVFVDMYPDLCYQ